MAQRNYVGYDLFVYSTVHSAVAAGAANTQTITVNADSDFRIEKLTMFADIAQAAETQSSQVLPLCTVQIIDNGSGRQLFDQAQPVPSLFGTGQIPFVLVNPKLWIARTSISVQLSNFSSATTYNVRLSFIGTKCFLAV